MSSSESQRGFGVVLFHSVQGALAAEKLLLAARVAYKLITVPRHLSSTCGFCVRIAWSERERVEELLPRDRLGVERIVAF